MKKFSRLFTFGILSLLSVVTLAQTSLNGPTMGWSSWNTYGCHISDTLIKQQADAMVSTGLAAKGYRYINTDDGYFNGRDAEGNLRVYRQRFPNGLRPMVDYIHSLGLKAGIYTDAGHYTCASYYGEDTLGYHSGCYEHDQMDCDMWFKDNNFDFIKVDFCGGFPGDNVEHLKLDERDRYTDIGQAILNTGRKDIRYNACRWAYPGTWISKVCGSWRTTGDIYLSWNSVRDILKENLYMSAYASLGHYNDMDMLEVGRGLTEEEDKTHFGMWCIMNSPLLIGCDLRSISRNALSLLGNEELIAINQDVVGQQAYICDAQKGCFVLVKDLEKSYGTYRAFAVYNPTDEEHTIEIRLSTLELAGKTTLRDLFEFTDATSLLNPSTGVITVTVPAHGTRIYEANGQRRIDRRRYEAETGYIEAYQELENNQTAKTGVYEYDITCSGGMKATWLGCNERNSLSFPHVHCEQSGRYRLTIACLCGEDRYMTVMVNGKRVKLIKANSGSWRKIAPVTIDVTLYRGDNVITFRNSENYMPDIDYMDVEKLQ